MTRPRYRPVCAAWSAKSIVEADGRPLPRRLPVRGVRAARRDVPTSGTGPPRRLLPDRQRGRLGPGLRRSTPEHLLRADRDAEAPAAELIGVFHSHTHTDAYPSPTDVAQAPDPAWHYVLVSLRDVHPSVRSWTDRGREDHRGAGRSTMMTGMSALLSRHEPATLEMPVTVDVRLPTVLRAAAGGQATVRGRGGDRRRGLRRPHPPAPGSARPAVSPSDGELHRHLNVFLNDDDIRYLGKLDAKVGDATRSR